MAKVEIPENKDSLAHLMEMLNKLNYSIQIDPRWKQIRLISGDDQVLKTFAMSTAGDIEVITTVIEWLEWKTKEPK